MKLTEKQAFKVLGKVLSWLNIEVGANYEGKEGISKISQEEEADFVMMELINLELGNE